MSAVSFTAAEDSNDSLDAEEVAQIKVSGRGCDGHPLCKLYDCDRLRMPTLCANGCASTVHFLSTPPLTNYAEQATCPA